MDADVPQCAGVGELSFARMGAPDLGAAKALFLAFLQRDPHYLEVASVYGDGGPAALHRALALFITKPELGFVWMARSGEAVVGCCVVCYAISTSRGAIVAKARRRPPRPGSSCARRWST